MLMYDVSDSSKEGISRQTIRQHSKYCNAGEALDEVEGPITQEMTSSTKSVHLWDSVNVQQKLVGW